MKSQIRIVILITTIAVFGAGCGIKGPPLPPIETVEDKTLNGVASPTAAPNAPAAAPEKETKTPKKTQKK